MGGHWEQLSEMEKVHRTCMGSVDGKTGAGIEEILREGYYAFCACAIDKQSEQSGLCQSSGVVGMQF